MARYTKEDLKNLCDIIHQGPNHSSIMRAFMFTLAGIDYNYSHIRRKSFKFYPEYQKFMRLPFRHVPKYLNTELHILAQWRLKINK